MKLFKYVGGGTKNPPPKKGINMSKSKSNEYMFYASETKTLIWFRAINHSDAVEYMEENNINKLKGKLLMTCGSRTRDED